MPATRTQLGAQAHGDLAVAASVRRAREDLRNRAAQLRAGRPGRVRQRVAVGRPREPRARERAPKVVSVGSQRGHRLGTRPGQSPSLSTRARNFLGRPPRSRASGSAPRAPARGRARGRARAVPSSTTALAAAAFCSYAYPARLPSMVSSAPLPNARYICRHLLTAASGTDSLFAAAARPEPSAKSPAASLLVSTSRFTLRSMRTRKPPISRVREMGGGSGFRSRPLVARPHARRLGFCGERGEKERRGRRGGPPRRPRARARDIRVERRPPVSGALLSHGLTPQYHRRSAA